MSNYIKTVDFAAKDALLTGNPSKLIKGTELGAEFDNIATAVTSKQDASGYTAADVLAKLLTVDGAASGLDADLLDGQSSAAFSTASHTHAASDITSGSFAETQITDGALLARNAANETISGTWTFSSPVLKTGQAFFNAQLTSGSTTLTAASITTVLFNTANTNLGGTSYATGTGIFTAPTTGFYTFSGMVVVDNSSAGTATINTVYFSKNNSTSGVAGRFFFGMPLVGGTLANGSNQAWFSGSVCCALTSGDTIRVKVDMGGANNCTANLGSTFSGAFLG